MDKQSYAKDVAVELDEYKHKLSNLSCENAADIIQELCTIIHQCAMKNCRRKVKPCRKRRHRWTPEIMMALKHSKEKFWDWKNAGKNKNPLCTTYIELKKSKKILRSLQRKEVASQRQEKLKKIMDLHENNHDGFYRLVRKQRDPKNSTASSFNFEGNVLYEESEIREAWADYFEELATPVNHDNYDQAHKLIVEKDVRDLRNLFTDEKIENIEPVTEQVVEEIILSFKNGESPDEMHMTAEHLKYGGSQLFYILTFIINFLFKNIHIPSMLKSGIVCPVFKNRGKPKDDPSSHRKITITSCVGKVVEKIHLSRNENRILSVQNKLQKGFTKGEIPSIAGLILTELCNEAIKRKSSLYIALMDARKSFDVLWHLGLLKGDE